MATVPLRFTRLRCGRMSGFLSRRAFQASTLATCSSFAIGASQSRVRDTLHSDAGAFCRASRATGAEQPARGRVPVAALRCRPCDPLSSTPTIPCHSANLPWAILHGAVGWQDAARVRGKRDPPSWATVKNPAREARRTPQIKKLPPAILCRLALATLKMAPLYFYT
jgi:hypothetical protein